MTYPRHCPHCQTTYAGPSPELSHVTLHATAGGTPSHRFPHLSGRVLTLLCLSCRDEYAWDFFADEDPPTVAERPACRLRW